MMKQERIMDISIKTEEAAITAISIYLLSKYNFDLPLWALVLLFFSPDISMLGYLINSRFGAFTYNLFHHRGIALVLFAVGFLGHMEILITTGILMMAHSSFDRMMGYGLKYPDDFSHTNLGWIGKVNKRSNSPLS